eukprot:5577861-Amphidinium_carterae.1
MQHAEMQDLSENWCSFRFGVFSALFVSWPCLRPIARQTFFKQWRLLRLMRHGKVWGLPCNEISTS